MDLNRDALRLYLITDPDLCADLGVVETVRRAVAGGVTMVQLRDKNASTAERVDLARTLLRVLDGSGVPLVVNDDLQAAIISGAHGAHVGQSDEPASVAREKLGPDRILGLSCETPDRVRAAQSAPVDYLGIGPVFATASKSDHEQPIGIAGLARLVGLSELPTVAIGGLKAGHVGQVMATGASGLSVVSAICGQPDPQAAAGAFFRNMGE